MDYKIRTLKPKEHPILAEFLYNAIFIPEGMEPPPKSIIEQPQLQLYISDWGKKDDYCLVAEVTETSCGNNTKRIIGAVWVRIMQDYGHIDDQTPSFAISLYKEFRGMGIGSELMKQMLTILKAQGYPKVSLSVQKANYAYKMYQKLGFQVVKETEEEYLMVKELKRRNVRCNP